MSPENYNLIKTWAILESIVFTVVCIINFFLSKVWFNGLIDRLLVSFFVAGQLVLLTSIPLLLLTFFINYMMKKFNNR
jgi:hypothetical protein